MEVRCCCWSTFVQLFAINIRLFSSSMKTGGLDSKNGTYLVISIIEQYLFRAIKDRTFHFCNSKFHAYTLIRRILLMIAEACKSSKKNILPLILCLAQSRRTAHSYTVKTVLFLLQMYLCFYYDLFLTQYVVLYLLTTGWSNG